MIFLKKYIFILLISLFILSMIGCGNKEDKVLMIDYDEPASDLAADVNVNDAVVDEPASLDSEVNESMEYLGSIEKDSDENIDDDNSEVVNNSNSNPSTIKIGNHDLQIHPEAANSGIILMTLYQFVGKGDVYYNVWSIDRNTGQVTLINIFHTPEVASNRNAPYYMADRVLSKCNAVTTKFNNDFSVMEATMFYPETGASHAGWIDNQDTFFDINQAVGDLAQREFERVDDYMAIGFTEDGGFIYSSNQQNLNFCIDVNSFALRQKDDSLLNLLGMPHYACTDKISDTEFLCGDRSITRHNLTDGEETTIIGGDAMYSFSGILGPNGNDIAFLAKPINGDGFADVYITTLDSATPEKIELKFSEGYEEFFKTSYINTCIIDWR